MKIAADHGFRTGMLKQRGGGKEEMSSNTIADCGIPFQVYQ